MTIKRSIRAYASAVRTHMQHFLWRTEEFLALCQDSPVLVLQLGGDEARDNDNGQANNSWHWRGCRIWSQQGWQYWPSDGRTLECGEAGVSVV